MEPFQSLRSSAGAASPDLLEAYERVDWAATAVGPPSTWSPALVVAVRLVLATPIPSVLFWGDERTYFYNDAIAAVIGDRHPAVLGQPAEASFPESWSRVGPLITDVLEHGRPAWLEDSLVPVERDGRVAEHWYSYAYSPVRDLDGTIVAVHGVSIETTRQVLAQRQLRLLNALGSATAGAQSLLTLRVAALGMLRNELPSMEVVDVRMPAPVTEPAAPGTRSVVPVAGAVEEADAEGAAVPGADRWWTRPDAIRPGHGIVAWEPKEDAEVPAGAVPLAALGPAAWLHGQTILVCRGDSAADEDLGPFLQVVADMLAAAVIRIRGLQGERADAASDRALSLELQAAMLASRHDTPRAEGPRTASRYVPASARQQVGGDWHDTFPLPDGPLVVAIGDVAGHDGRSAAAMGQLRSLVRGIVLAGTRSSSRPSPAQVTELLDQAIAHFEVDAVATFLLAEVVLAERPGGGRGYTIRWANAGHPPPVLLGPDGTAALLDDAGQMLLGIDPETVRSDLEANVPAGSTLLLYTDGLVERRGELLDAGMERLRAAVADQPDLGPDALCDHVLTALGPFEDDDVAILAVRLG
ncbi:PP2C family protein-serine/threonine phosphatase [Nocardioides zeae]|uniref:Serine phosphatase RsbU (Regulator of sigma subunit) n=1 Tax=Nocardioides zeae TaxID=1457234 RepID=A0AAJ1U939_9ACTN|nr:PP2C family protein-serine/threonine phosphatase [Nocardioides zeae]MDQ1105792.1 serine phosphatase RsbU (regulator of sigma subunit) [Nocardioides zeae]